MYLEKVWPSLQCLFTSDLYVGNLLLKDFHRNTKAKWNSTFVIIKGNISGQI